MHVTEIVEKDVVRTIKLAVMGERGVKVEVEAEIVCGMAVYADPDKPDRLRIASQTGKTLVRIRLAKSQALRALPLLDGALPKEVKHGEKSVSAWKREDRAAWTYYDQMERHIIASVQLDDWK